MEKSEGEVKHLVLAKFNEDLSEQQIADYIKQYANLVHLIPSMKSFRWFKNVSAENLDQGITHIFESTFDSTQGIADYVVHPDHVKLAGVLLPRLDKIVVVDYNLTHFQLS